MHCSTGPSYLIINGDIASTPNVNNLFYAIPLVDLGSPLNITQGTIADKNQFLINGKFTIPATTPFQMTFNTDLAAIIGGSPLPSDPTRPLVSDIVVLDDTVYVSLTSTTGPLNETGILYSQAQFDQTGKIHSWTPWTRRAFPYNGFVNSQSIFGPVLFFDVDAVTGSLWAVNGNGATPTTVVMTAWDAPETTLAPQIPNYTVNVSLTAELNKQFGTNPCTSVLDLDQSTAGFTNGALSYPYRYALFGGIGSVTFAVTSQAFNNTINSPQEVTVDYSQPGYLLATTVPTCLPITVMEYARQLPGTIDNYFFAGAADGLYVFDNGLGGSFDANSLGLLNAYPFIGHNWIKIDPTLMPGAILDIKTSGLALYVLTYTTSPTTPMQTTIYSIDFQPTVGAMFTASNIVTIAQSGTDVFSSVSLFTGMQIINPSNNADQLVITTNVGLYRSAKIGGVQAAISQTDANWQLIGTTTPYFNGIAAVDNASLVGSFSTKVWPFAFQSPTTAMIFNRSIWNQVCGTVSGAPYNFVPSFFNASDTSGAFATLPLTQYFWSDGGRRLAVTNPMKSVPACTNVRKTGVVCSPPQKCPSQQLFCLPFNTQEWAISGTSAQILSNSILDNYQRFYWIKDIGTTGILMVGTNSGVVALE